MSKKFEVVTVFWSATKSSKDALSLQNVDRLETLLNDGFRIVRDGITDKEIHNRVVAKTLRLSKRMEEAQ